MLVPINFVVAMLLYSVELPNVAQRADLICIEKFVVDLVG